MITRSKSVNPAIRSLFNSVHSFFTREERGPRCFYPLSLEELSESSAISENRYFSLKTNSSIPPNSLIFRIEVDSPSVVSQRNFEKLDQIERTTKAQRIEKVLEECLPSENPSALAQRARLRSQLYAVFDYCDSALNDERSKLNPLAQELETKGVPFSPLLTQRPLLRLLNNKAHISSMLAFSELIDKISISFSKNFPQIQKNDFKMKFSALRLHSVSFENSETTPGLITDVPTMLGPLRTCVNLSFEPNCKQEFFWDFTIDKLCLFITAGEKGLTEGDQISLYPPQRSQFIRQF